MLILSPVYFGVTTGLNGTADFSFKVPGIYGGLVPVNPAAGRYLQYAEFWCDTPATGDLLTGLRLTDDDTVLSPLEQAVCPNYPDVVLFQDIGTLPPGLSTGLYIHNNPPARIEPFRADGQSAVPILPSQLYLKGTFTSGSLLANKVFRCNLIWGRFVPG